MRNCVALTDPGSNLGVEQKLKPPQTVGFDFWQPQIHNIRTNISLYEAEIQELLDSLESFLNDLKQ